MDVNIAIIGFDPGENSGCALYLPETNELAGLWSINLFSNKAGSYSDKRLRVAMNMMRLSASISERMDEWGIEPMLTVLAVEDQFFWWKHQNNVRACFQKKLR